MLAERLSDHGFRSCQSNHNDNGFPIIDKATPNAVEVINGFGCLAFEQHGDETSDATGKFLSPWTLIRALDITLCAVNTYRHPLHTLKSNLGVSNLDALSTQIRHIADILARSSSNKYAAFSDANSVWLKPQFNFQLSYIQGLQQSATTGRLTSASTVNSWIKSATHGTITDIVNDYIVDQVDLMLVNAIWFKAKWQFPFRRIDTSDDPFYPSDGATYNTPTMHSTLQTRHLTNQGFNYSLFNVELPKTNTYHNSPLNNTVECVAVKLPYVDNTFHAILSMPRIDSIDVNGHISSISEYEWALAACHKHVLLHLCSNTKSSKGVWYADSEHNCYDELCIAVPKFELEANVELTEVLDKLGLPRFTLLEKIAVDRNTNAVQDIPIDAAIQNLYCKVDEEGTEAACTTSIFGGATSAPFEIKCTLPVKFNHPFTFTLVHTATGVALLTGIVQNPSPKTHAEQININTELNTDPSTKRIVFGASTEPQSPLHVQAEMERIVGEAANNSKVVREIERDLQGIGRMQSSSSTMDRSIKIFTQWTAGELRDYIDKTTGVRPPLRSSYHDLVVEAEKVWWKERKSFSHSQSNVDKT